MTGKLLGIGIAAFAMMSAAASADFNGAADNQTDAYDYYYVMTGGIMDGRPGGLPNGDNAHGGTMRYIHDDPSSWSQTANAWQRDDWFPTNVGVALTMENGGSTVYDNNGIDAGTHGGFYDYGDLPEGSPSSDYSGLFRGYSMSNNYDWIYSGIFYISETTTIDTLNGYFDGNGFYSLFDPSNEDIAYRMNIWSAVTDGTAGDGTPYYMPATDSFTGNVYSTDSATGTFSVGDTGLDRVIPDWLAGTDDDVYDDIYRLSFAMDSSIVLEPGFYFFSHDAVIIPAPGAVLLAMVGLPMVGWIKRRKA
jgi:hypothetical protein